MDFFVYIFVFFFLVYPAFGRQLSRRIRFCISLFGCPLALSPSGRLLCPTSHCSRLTITRQMYHIREKCLIHGASLMGRSCDVCKVVDLRLECGLPLARLDRSIIEVSYGEQINAVGLGSVSNLLDIKLNE